MQLFLMLFIIFVEQGRFIPGHPRGAQMMRVSATDGTEQGLTGACLYFIRLKTDVALTQQKDVGYRRTYKQDPVVVSLTN